jgi:hypothetical protein
MSVAIVEEIIFAKVFPIKTTLRRRSGRANILFTRIACLLFFLTRYFNLYLLIDIIPISDPEKNPDKIIKKNKIINNVDK